MNAKQSKTCTCCTCDYQWERGRDGYHVCSAELLKTIQNLKAAVTLAFGDQVAFVEDRPLELRKMIPTGTNFVITDISVTGNSLEYAVNGSAWYSREDLELLARANDESLATAIAFNNDELEDEEIEIEGEDDEGLFDEDEEEYSIRRRNKPRGTLLDEDEE